MIPFDTSLEAIYSDGFILDETLCNDISPFNSNENILRAILNKDPEAEHGPLVSLSCFYKNQKYTIDWTMLPENARPIRFRHMEADQIGGEITEVRCSGLDFGYQYTDNDAKNIQEVKELL